MVIDNVRQQPRHVLKSRSYQVLCSLYFYYFRNSDTYTLFLKTACAGRQVLRVVDIERLRSESVLLCFYCNLRLVP